MKKLRIFSPNTFKIISFVITAIIMLWVNIVCTNFLLKKSNVMTLEQYIDSCTKITDGYTESVHAFLQKEKAAFSSLYKPDFLKQMTPLQIQDHLKELYEHQYEDFHRLFYIDKDGNAYPNSGKNFNCSSRNYYQKLILEDYDEFIDNPVRSRIDYSPVYVYGKSLHDKDSNVIGALCASVKLSTISSLIDEISIDKQGYITIEDSNGSIIAHPDNHQWISQVFNQDTKIINLDSNISRDNMIDALEESKHISDRIYAFKKKIPDTQWTVSYSVPVNSIKEIISTQHFYQLLIILFSTIATALIIIFEFWITNYFQKKQMIASFYDPLTNLMTREHFEKEAQKIMNRNKGSKFMLFEADVRNFKIINQTYSQKKADELLLYLSKVLNDFTVFHHGIMCRGYADRFYVFFKITSIHKAMEFFKKNLLSVQEEFREYSIPFTTKFGITFSIPRDEIEPPTIQHMIGQTTFAKKSIKDNALVQYAIFDTRLSAKNEEIHYIETHMQKSLDEKEFFVVYQPKVDLKTDKIIGAEALVRWENSELGYMAPDSFIPLFEKNNFIIKLDFFVYEEVFKFIRKCLDSNINVVPISVNMSRNHIHPDRFVHTFISLMKKYDIPSNLIEVELLERSSIDKNTLRDITLLLHKEGLKVAMDDFGSGESSLNMLSNIPVDVLKFDRSFLLTSDQKNADIDKDRANFIETLVDLGKNLNKKTVFEGVETEEQLNFLKSIKCDAIQGFFYSKPLKEEDFVKFIKKHG